MDEINNVLNEIVEIIERNNLQFGDDTLTVSENVEFLLKSDWRADLIFLRDLIEPYADSDIMDEINDRLY